MRGRIELHDGVEVVRVLTLKQPYAWLVVHGGKQLENRARPNGYRGKFLIHAGADCSVRYYCDAVDWVTMQFGAEVAGQIPSHEVLVRGALVGRARVESCLAWGGWGGSVYPKGVDGRWHMQDQYALVLRDIAPTAVVRWSGKQACFFREPLERVEAVLPGTREWLAA